MIYEPQEKDIELFGGYSTIVSEAKYKVIHGQGIKISNIRQMLQRLPIALAQVKAENTSENLLNEIGQIIYCLQGANKITKKSIE